MRILKRPMFRYGGPIKEGIMQGVRSNYAGGQRVMPTSDGSRPGYAGPLLAAVPWLLRAASIPFGRWATKQALKKGIQAGTGSVRSGLGRSVGAGSQGTKNIYENVNKFTPYKFWSQDPLYKAGATGAGWAGKGLKKGYQIAKAGVTTPSGIATTGGLAWMFWPDGTPKTGDDLAKAAAAAGKKPGHGDEGMYYEKPPVTKSAEELAAEAKAARTKKLNKYLDTMGYDKAKKTAMGDALIDASAIVQDATTEAGSLKKADWGKMINKAIQTTSKRLDKPEQIREAVGLMLTKSEIEKDMEDPQTKELRRLQIAGAEKALAGKTLTEQVAEYTNKHGTPTGTTLSGIARSSGIDAKVYTGATEWMNKNEGKDAIDFIENEVSIAKEKGATINPGIFVVKDRIIAIDETGKITPVY